MAGIKNIIVVLASLFVVAQVSFALGADKSSYNADIVSSPQTYSYKYDGNRISSLTGSLVAFGARMYDPHTGRWTTQDPMAWKYLSQSPYNYCGNNPVNLVDPDGMDTKIVVSNHRILGRNGYQYVAITCYYIGSRGGVIRLSI